MDNFALLLGVALYCRCSGPLSRVLGRGGWVVCVREKVNAVCFVTRAPSRFFGSRACAPTHDSSRDASDASKAWQTPDVRVQAPQERWHSDYFSPHAQRVFHHVRHVRVSVQVPQVARDVHAPKVWRGEQQEPQTGRGFVVVQCIRLGDVVFGGAASAMENKSRTEPQRVPDATVSACQYTTSPRVAPISRRAKTDTTTARLSAPPDLPLLCTT